MRAARSIYTHYFVPLFIYCEVFIQRRHHQNASSKSSWTGIIKALLLSILLRSLRAYFIVIGRS